MKSDLHIFCNGLMDLVYIIIDRFIVCLYPSRHINLPLQLLPLIFTGQPFQFFYQLPGFLFCYKLCGLYRIHQ